jgi:transcriptional regulator GlxA family with amidase domain
MTWRQDRRFVADRGVVTAMGVSASLPVSLALVEAIAGRERADQLPHDLGVASFDEARDSAAFQAVDGVNGRGALNTLGFLGHETVGV